MGSCYRYRLPPMATPSDYDDNDDAAADDDDDDDDDDQISKPSEESKWF